MSHFWRLKKGGGNECVISSKTEWYKSKTTLGNSQKKVALQSTRDTPKKIGIQILAFENFVGIATIAMQLHCQPSYRATLKFQLLPNHFSDM